MALLLMADKNTPIKILPWGEKVFKEIPIYKFQNQMYARFGENSEGKKFIEISKFGPIPAERLKEGDKTTYSQKLRLFKPSHWGKLKHIIESELFPEIGWTKENAEINIELSVLQNLTSKVKKQDSQLSESKKTVAELMDNIAAYRDLNLKNRIPEFKKTLEEFKALVNANKTENYYQAFLKKNFWIFGLEYISVRSQKSAGASNRPDFSLERYDKFRDIVEIKRPQDAVFVKLRTNRLTQGPKLKEALAEVMDYVDYFLKHVNDEVVEYGETYYKPKAIIVIGRSQDWKDKIRQLNSFIHRIEIITYDDLIERAAKIIEFYEK